MTNIAGRVLVCLAMALAATSSYAGQRVLDVSTPSGTKMSLTGPPGEVVTFTIVNKMPNKRYTVTVEERAITIPPLPTPTGLAGAFADDLCKPILTDAESLGKATDETQVGEIVRRVRTALLSANCPAPAQVAKINEWLAQTVHSALGQFVLRAGAELVLTVTRDEKVWTMVVSGGERGTWLTTYGVAIVPSQDEPYFAKALDGGKFAVTAERDLDDVRLIPSVFFSWLPRKRMLRDFSFGPTTGLGLSKSKAAVFGGVGLTYNWNLAFIAGIAVSPHTRLRGRHKPGDELTENLSDEQLNRDVFRPTWVFAMTFRFAGNPFGAGGDDTASEDEKADDKGAAAKKAAEKEAAGKKAAAEKEAAEKKAAEEK